MVVRGFVGGVCSWTDGTVRVIVWPNDTIMVQSGGREGGGSCGDGDWPDLISQMDFHFVFLGTRRRFLEKWIFRICAL